MVSHEVHCMPHSLADASTYRPSIRTSCGTFQAWLCPYHKKNLDIHIWFGDEAPITLPDGTSYYSRSVESWSPFIGFTAGTVLNVKGRTFGKKALSKNLRVLSDEAIALDWIIKDAYQAGAIPGVIQADPFLVDSAFIVRETRQRRLNKVMATLEAYNQDMARLVETHNSLDPDEKTHLSFLPLKLKL